MGNTENRPQNSQERIVISPEFRNAMTSWETILDGPVVASMDYLENLSNAELEVLQLLPVQLPNFDHQDNLDADLAFANRMGFEEEIWSDDWYEAGDNQINLYPRGALDVMKIRRNKSQQFFNYTIEQLH